MSDDAISRRKVCDIRAEHGARNRAAFLEAIHAGATIAEACQTVGWTSRSTYRQNRRRYRSWAYQVDYERILVEYPIRFWPAVRYGGPDSKWPFLRTFNY